MDLLAQYSDASGEGGAGDGDTDDDVATTAAMLRAKHAVPDLAPRVNDAGLAVAYHVDDLAPRDWVSEVQANWPPVTLPGCLTIRFPWHSDADVAAVCGSGGDAASEPAQCAPRDPACARAQRPRRQ